MMNYYKTYRLKKRDIKIQCSIAIPKTVIEYLGLRDGDELRLTIQGGKIVLRPIRHKK